MELLKSCRSVFSLLCILVFFFCVPTESTNILVIDGVASPSHQIWMRALSFALGAQPGYNVTVLSPTPAKGAPDNVHYLSMSELWAWMEQDMDFDLLAIPDMGPFELLMSFIFAYEPQDEVVLNSSGFKALLNYPKDFQFDLIIYDYLSPYSLASLKEVFRNPPTVAVSAYPGIGMTNLMTHGPEFFSFLPHMLKDGVKDCFWDRLENFLISTLYYFVEQYYILPTATKSVRKVIPHQVQSVKEQLESSVIQMANYHPVIDSVQPIMPSVIPVGGLQIAEPKPLPADLEEIYSRESKGNVLFSLGSNVKSELLGKERLTEIVAALTDLPEYNFIWKIDMKGLDLELPKNVFIRDWLPQNDMLADNRTVLFMSHAGGLSTQECTWFGVPMLALPVMFDQFPNSERVVKMGMGLKLDIRYLKKEELKATILQLVTNEEFSRKAKLMSRNFRDQPQTPMDRALWWIDYVLRNPDVSFLQNKKLKDMNYVVKHSIDVIVFVTILVLIFVGSVVKIIVWLVKKRPTKRKAKKE